MTSPETDIDEQGQESQAKPRLTLEVQVDKPSACRRHITVTVARADVDRYFDESYSELMPNANVPGFRAGRAPRKLVEQRFREQVSDQVKGQLLMETMTQINEDYDFSAISEPEFDFEAIEIPEAGPLTFEFDLEVRPEFDLPKWKGLSLDRLTREFTPQDVDVQLRRILSDYGEWEIQEGGAEADDHLSVNLTTRHHGEVVAEAEAVAIQIKPIVSFPDARVEGFDTLMTGAKAGDRRTAKVVLSHDAPLESLQGEEVEVEFEVVEVNRSRLPELNEHLLKDLGDYATEGDLRDDVKESLVRRMQYQQQQRARNQITSLLIQTADWELPPDLLKRQARRELDRAVMEMRASGFGDDEISAYENELRQNSLASTKKALKEHFILERIAEDENIDAEPADYDAEIALVAAQSREPVRRVRARIEKKGLMDVLRNQIIERKVIALIKEHAKFRDVKYTPEVNETAPVDIPLSGRSESEIPEAKHGDDSQPLQQPVDRG
jgi:trigger factor